MARTLAHGRITKVDPGETIRKAGFTGAYDDKAPPGAHMDQLIFEAQGYEHILGSASQVAADFATITWDFVQQRFEDKAGSEVVLGDYERVAVIGMDVFTGDMVIDNVVGLEMFHIGATPGQSGNNPKFELGDAGGGIPYKIFLGPNTSECKLDLKTTTDFRTLLNVTYGSGAFTPYGARYIANQGVDSYIRVNDCEAYNPCKAGQIVKFDTPPINPYYIRMDGQLFAYASNPSVDGIAWFRDLNIALDGYRFNGTSFDETSSRFTVSPSAYLSQVNSANRFFTDISALDTRVHQRTDPFGISIAATADFVNTSNVVTFQGGAGNIKNNMRINGVGLPGIPVSPVGTTILRNIDTSVGTAEMYDALTGAAVNATSTVTGIAVTLDNSGAAGGSHDVDYAQAHRHHIATTETADALDPLVTAQDPVSAQLSQGNDADYQLKYNDDVPFAEPTLSPTSQQIARLGEDTPRTHDQTQPISAGVYYYYKV